MTDHDSGYIPFSDNDPQIAPITPAVPSDVPRDNPFRALPAENAELRATRSRTEGGKGASSGDLESVVSGRFERLVAGILLVAAIFFGGAFRIDAVSREYDPKSDQPGDATIYYISAAESLLAGNGLVPSYRENFIPPPLQSFFIAGVKWAVPRADYQLLRAAQAVLAIAALVLVFWIGKQLAGALAGGVAALIFAFDPDVIGASSSLLAESNYFFLMFAFITVLIVALRRGGLWWMLAAGLLLGLTSLQKSFPMLLVGLLPLYFLVRYRSWRSVGQSLVFVVGFAAVVAPWIVRNHEKYGQWYAISTNSGKLLAQSNFLTLDPSNPDMIYWEQIDKLEGWKDPEIEAEFQGQKDAYGKDEWNLKDRAYKAHAMAYIRTHPVHFAKNYCIKLFNIFRYPGKYDRGHSLRYCAQGSQWPFPEYRHLWVLVGLIGVSIFVWRERRRHTYVLLPIFLYFVAFTALFHITMRGRINLPMKLLLTLFSAYMVAVVIRGLAALIVPNRTEPRASERAM